MSIAIGAIMPASLGTFGTAAASSFATEVVAGALTGEFDLGQALAGAAFAGVSSWATSVINADTLGITFGDGANVALLGFGDDLTLAAIVESGIDSAITAGLSSVVYGTDFGAGFLSSLGNSLATLATADFQTLIGDQGLNEGGFAHLGLHGLVGCISAAATGADCAAGALGGVVQSIYAGTLEGKGPDPADYATKEDYDAAYGAWEAKVGTTANLIGGVVGYAFSGGSAANVSATASIAQSGILNNYLWHQQAEMLETAKSDLAACEARGNCSPEKLAFLHERIAYFNGLDSFTDQELRAQCDADPTGAACKAYVADALCAAELRSTALCGGVPGIGLERWGYRDNNEIWKANMFANGRDYSPGFGIASANLQHQQDTFDLLAQYADSVAAVHGNDSIGIAIELGGAAIVAGVLVRIPKGSLQGLAGSFGERQFQLSKVELDGLLTQTEGVRVLEIWDQGRFTPIQRGNFIEDYLATADYSDWFRVGSENNGFSPAWDFSQGSTWVSLKTLDTNGSGWQSSMRTHINELEQWGSPTNPNVTKVLDIRVQPGGAATAQSLIDYGASRGVLVRINEF